MDMFLSTLSTLYTKSHKVDEVDEITPQQTRYINHQPRKETGSAKEKTWYIEKVKFSETPEDFTGPFDS